ncbi:unnamed protein product [Paramecium primaurelia]|uniref:Uncharacterized protein n=1 Tax=Paramecium primaurelia TaxID=5886 RepID=A0A8S1LJI5_PARPR|nr:unnamed protein product [Paramecium primaurelia]
MIQLQELQFIRYILLTVGNIIIIMILEKINLNVVKQAKQ